MKATGASIANTFDGSKTSDQCIVTGCCLLTGHENNCSINLSVRRLRVSGYSSCRFKKLEMELADAQAAADDFTYALQADASGEAASATRRGVLEEELFFMPLTAGARGASISTATLPVGVY